MRVTSVLCLLNPDAQPRKGFTLLELLVVMALMALAAGLVTPAVQRSIGAARERAVAGDLAALLDSLPVRAFQRGSELTVDALLLRQWLPDLPEGWKIDMPQSLKYSATGVATGGRVIVLAPGQQPMEWTIGVVTGQAVRSSVAGNR